MNKIICLRSLLPLVVVCWTCEMPVENPLYFGQGVMVGEVTSSSAIFQTRLTKTDSLQYGELQGQQGFVKWKWWPKSDVSEGKESRWMEAIFETDYIVKHPVQNLIANTNYSYEVTAATDTTHQAVRANGTFRTNPGLEQRDSVSFVVVTGMNYYFYHYGNYDKSAAYQGADKQAGFPALKTIVEKKPDYFIGTGDNVYFDHPAKKNYQRALADGKDPLPGLFGGQEVRDEDGMRRKYHVQFSQPRFRRLFSQVATYWEKDDHDYRVNDGDPFSDFPISHELGIKNFREQLPVVDLNDKTAKKYRTHRMSKDVQLWFLEGRDYRDANNAIDGPEKSLWGIEQRNWLNNSLLSSDAKYKLIISPTPMVGPDDAYKKDNHVNPLGFRTEGEAFFQWLGENEFSTDELFIICGDRHWQYHAVHPSGYQEFSCGALVDANSRAGRLAGDPKSTDPDAQIEQLYVQGTKESATGGFLEVKIGVSDTSSFLNFNFYDELGALQYRFRSL